MCETMAKIRAERERERAGDERRAAPRERRIWASRLRTSSHL